ncbi:hypothetical protein ABFT23_15700 [Nocardioides sp. C4-1]|uniref:hypothetical protein n=1 Tax=Nocardioides sp. C4-1 TaxID=3151851 RepID=UPI0032650CB8
MRPLHHTQPDEVTTVAMENDLLRLEVAHLRARLKSAESELLFPGKPAPTASAGADGDADPLSDLRWLLQRIEATPLAHVLRRRSGYRRLVETYLHEDAG